jgi:hypothetical protein
LKSGLKTCGRSEKISIQELIPRYLLSKEVCVTNIGKLIVTNVAAPHDYVVVGAIGAL